MRHAALSTVLVSTFIFAATPAQGGPIDVRVLSAKFTAFIHIEARHVPFMETKTSTGPDPVSESVSPQGICDVNFSGEFLCDSGSSDLVGILTGDAAASFLEVSAIGNSSVNIGSAGVWAESEWTFSPLRDGVAHIDIYGIGIFHSQSASLLDLTTNEQVWQFFDNSWGGGVRESLPTFFDADHVYAMHLTANAGSLGDYADSTLRVSGIQAVVVPDNVDTFMCLCMGLLVALLGKWKLLA